MKNTNLIQEQLVKKSKEEIKSLIGDVMLLIQDFEKEARESNSQLGWKSDGLHWPVDCGDFWNVQSKSFGKPNFSHKSYDEISNLLCKSIEYNLLYTMVEGKTKQLLKKIDLF